MIFEEQFIFFPAVYPDGNYELIPRSLSLEDHWFTAPDGVRLHGWLLRADSTSPALVISHGNAGNISHRLEFIRQLHRLGCTVFIYDYRGYGRSEGSPSEEGVYLDGTGAFDYLASLDGIDPKRVALFGQSLGGAVAVHVAAKRRPAALILEATFSSARDVAAELYSFLPARFFLRSKFDSESTIRKNTAPLLMLHGSVDSIIPVKLGRKLFDAANPPKEFIEIRGASHNDVYLVGGDRYLQKIREFLHGALPPP